MDVPGGFKPYNLCDLLQTSSPQYQQQQAPTFTRPAPRPHRLKLVYGTTPRTAQDDRVITVTFQVGEAHAPALRSAIEEISDAVATRVEGKFQNPTEHALTCALVGLGQLRAALYPKVPAGDPNYRGRR